ncbi:hypothetical protein BS50DRAFT_272247 [Corynespora cassiicola Philippines]|uniref:Uncharacterized protein n=1 Tax=Corynespora cassiicola Philippines TaxID=1448308 RepID=A0A2T2P060_CORCC|nr:hypothetical protein BS50DRAFT_272247 [Corynespora cassiicola Philippines]
MRVRTFRMSLSLSIFFFWGGGVAAVPPPESRVWVGGVVGGRLGVHGPLVQLADSSLHSLPFPVRRRMEGTKGGGWIGFTMPAPHFSPAQHAKQEKRQCHGLVPKPSQQNPPSTRQPPGGPSYSYPSPSSTASYQHQLPSLSFPSGMPSARPGMPTRPKMGKTGPCTGAGKTGNALGTVQGYPLHPEGRHCLPTLSHMASHTL